MTEGLVFECFYTRRYRPLRCKMTTFMAVIFLWQFPPLFFAISPKNSSYSPPPIFAISPERSGCRTGTASKRQATAKWRREAPGPRPDTKKRQPFRLSLFWSGKRGSDPRPQPWQGCALPTELFPHSLSRLGLQIYNDILNPQKNLQFFREIYTSIEVLNSLRNRRSFSK